MDVENIQLIFEVHDVIQVFKVYTRQRFENLTKDYLVELASYEKLLKKKTSQKKQKLELNKPQVLPSITEVDELDAPDGKSAGLHSSTRGKRKAALKVKKITEEFRKKSRGRKKRGQAKKSSSISRIDGSSKSIQKEHQSEQDLCDVETEEEEVIPRCEVVLTKVSDQWVNEFIQSTKNSASYVKSGEATSCAPNKSPNDGGSFKKAENVTSLKVKAKKTQLAQSVDACASNFPEKGVESTAPFSSLRLSDPNSSAGFLLNTDIETDQKNNVQPPNTTVILKKAADHLEEIKEFKSPVVPGTLELPKKRITRSKQRTQDKPAASMRSSSSEEDGLSKAAENISKVTGTGKPAESQRALEQPAKRITRSKQRTQDKPAASFRSSSSEEDGLPRAAENILKVTATEKVADNQRSSSSEGDGLPRAAENILKVAENQSSTQPPPMMVTRSKQRTYDKPSASSRLESDTDDNQRLDVDASKDMPQMRITRSKRAAPKEDKEVKSSSDEASPKKKSFFSPPNHIGTVNVKQLQSIFTPASSSEKENFGNRRKVEESWPKSTPLRIQNALITPSMKPKYFNIIPSASKSKTAMDDAERRRKEEEAQRKRMKEEEARRKKNELLKAKQEEIRRKNEEKMLRRARQQAANKETIEKLQKMEKEKEEREKYKKEYLDKKKEEESATKKKMNEIKATEVEARRMKEEQARLARIKEMEEEKKREEGNRQKLLEEAERARKQRLEELRMKEAAMKAREAERKKINNLVAPLKDKDNYDISDDKPGESDDEDDTRNLKKDIPMWARKGEEKEKKEMIQSLVNKKMVADYFACPSQTPDLTDFFGNMTMKRVRTSSAVWYDTPPLKRKSVG